MAENDPMNVAADIRRLQEASQKIKTYTDEMAQAHEALRHIDNTQKGDRTGNSTGIESFTIGNSRFITKYVDPAMSKAQAHLEDAIRLYLAEQIRVAYERIQNLKETF